VIGRSVDALAYYLLLYLDCDPSYNPIMPRNNARHLNVQSEIHMYSTTDLDSAARSSHNEDGENAIDAYMDKFARVIELMSGDDQFDEWHNAFGDMLHAAVFETMDSTPLDLDLMIKWLDPSNNMPMASGHVMHDLGGIVGHFDPTIGKIDPTFSPRFAKLDHHWVDEHIVE